MTKIKNIIPTKFKDVKLFKLTSYDDDRGFFREVFNEEVESLGLFKQPYTAPVSPTSSQY